MKKNLIGLSALLIACSAYAQTEVTAGVMRGKDYGVTYLLPKTEIEIVLSVSHRVYTPGEFCKYAERYLRLKDVDPAPHDYFALERVETRAVGTPDKEKVYFVKLKDKTVAPLMELTEDGIVRSINLPLEKQETNVAATQLQWPEKVDPRNFLTEEILMASSSAKMAELVAREIYLIRESRNSLLRGEADNMPQDGAQLKLMLDNLNAQEQALVSMFAGSTEVTNTEVKLRIPVAKMENEVVFRFSKRLGVVEKDDLVGEPYLLTVQDLTTPQIEGVEAAKKEPEGVAYNVPGRALVTLSHENREIYREEIPVTQFGTKEYLAPVLFNKNSTTKVLFDTTTGGIIKVDRE